MRSIYVAPWRIDITSREGVDWPLSAVAIARSAAAALDAAGAPSPASLAVILTNDAELTSLNEQHMGEHGPTDVLSFPLLAPSAFPPHPGQHAGTRTVPKTRTSCFLRASVSIWATSSSLLSVRSSRPEQGRGGQTGDVRWSMADEVRLLVIHGALHVCGWDHADADERDAMRGWRTTC